MTLKFPSKPEVRLGKSPLEEVICQVKFAPILRISKDQPIELQESLRESFPGLLVEQGVVLQLPGVGSSENPNVEATPKIFRFLSKDKMTNVALAVDFIALTSREYTHWHEFLNRLMDVLGKVNEIYRPSFATRIGLRFVNRFTRKNTGSKNASEILDLFRSEFTCLIRSEPWTEPLEMLSQITLSDGKARLAIRNRFGKDKSEPYFLLDLDYYEEGQLPLDGLEPRIERYHSRIYEAFRWCLYDESLDKFQPLS